MSITLIKELTEVESDLSYSQLKDQSNGPENTVLIVDDEVEILNLMETLLEMNGYKVVRAESGEKALEIAKEI